MSAPVAGAVPARAPGVVAERAVLYARVTLTLIVMTVGAIVMLAVAIPTLFMARRLYAEGIGRCLGWLSLRIWGIRYTVRGEMPDPRRQVVYVSNHTSTLDIFVLIGLALPRTRFFLSGFLRKIPPIGIIGYLIRIFWTVPQEYPEKRTQIFRRAERVLRRCGDSVYLSPEGMRVTTGEIGHFNKGSFHLATALGAPMVPMYLAIPDESNPGMGYHAKPGTIDVWVLPAVETSGWRVEDVERNRDRMHDFYVRIHDAVRSGRSPEGMTLDGGAR